MSVDDYPDFISYWFWQGMCRLQAATYYDAVRQKGGPFYESAQKKACGCKDEKNEHPTLSAGTYEAEALNLERIRNFVIRDCRRECEADPPETIPDHALGAYLDRCMDECIERRLREMQRR
jgi:hypothetical protein